MLRSVAFLLIFGTLPLSQAQQNFSGVLAEIKKIQKESGIRAASIGLCMIPMESSDTEAMGYHMDSAMIPASTMKVVTTATALEKLGAQFRFETKLQITGPVVADGTLRGSIVVKGGGDPTLGESQITNTFAKWKAALVEAGIKRIQGSIIGDASIFGTQRVPDSWQWGDMGNYYGAGACGLNFHRNQFFCTFRTRSAGSKAILLGTDPRLPGVEFYNEMHVGASGSGDQGRIFGSPYGNVFVLRGTLPPHSSTYTIKGALPDPAYFCARAFTKYLVESGIEVMGQPKTDRLLAGKGKPIGEQKTIYSQFSIPLEKIVVLTNHRSINLWAESIYRMIGVRFGRESSPKFAGKVVRDYWAEKGIDMEGFQMEDGSGLSLANTVTARQMALILRRAADSPIFDQLYSSLPVAGRSGTLRSIGRGTSVEGRVRAKSGTIHRVKNFAGYVNTRSGKRYAFALLINHYTCSHSSVKNKIVRIWKRMITME